MEHGVGEELTGAHLIRGQCRIGGRPGVVGKLKQCRQCLLQGATENAGVISHTGFI